MNPCSYCANYREGPMDMDTGYVDIECLAEEEFEGCEKGIPCPSFTPILASDGLMEQLFNEHEEEIYREMEEIE